MRTYKVSAQVNNREETFLVEEINPCEGTENLEYFQDYTKHYKVSVFGSTLFYLAKGHKTEPDWIVLWYASSKRFHRSFGKTFKDTIEMGLEDIVAYSGIYNH